LRQWSRAIRWFATAMVILWAVAVVQSQMSRRLARDPYATPHRPYVAVAATHSPDGTWAHWLWEAGRNVVAFMFYSN
jgi:O-methyltransferase involved in polyketide biosynthesis